jgi:hypothetical protein
MDLPGSQGAAKGKGQRTAGRARCERAASHFGANSISCATVLEGFFSMTFCPTA